MRSAKKSSKKRRSALTRERATFRAIDEDVGLAFDAIARAYMAAGIGASAFIRIARRRYALAAAKDIAEISPPGKRLSISRMAAATGLNRKEIPQLLGVGKQGIDAISQPEKFLAPSGRLLHGWMSQSAYVGSSGKPLDIWYSKGKKSFCALVQTFAPDVTPISMLKELIGRGLVQEVGSKKLRIDLRGVSKISLRAKELPDFDARLDVFAEQLRRSLSKDSTGLFMDAVVAEGLSPAFASLFARVFTERAKGLLSAVPKWLEANPSEKVSCEPGKSIGLGIYLFDKTVSELSNDAKRASRKGARIARPVRLLKSEKATTPRAKRA